MPFSLEGTVGGRSLEARAEARGEARGLAHGRQQLLTDLMRRSFGDHPRLAAIAENLSSWPQDKALDAVLSADSIEVLERIARG
jgi:hypothetical protein